MERLIINATHNTPLVWIEPATRTAVIVGDSLPENAIAFYDPIMRWLENHPPARTGPVHWHFRLHYFNTSSMKGIYQLLHDIKQRMLVQSGHSVVWDVEDGDEFMQEAGENFMGLLGIEMELNTVSEEAAVAETMKLHATVRELLPANT
jgi:SiaC family regulatory phosphoprotein